MHPTLRPLTHTVNYTNQKQNQLLHETLVAPLQSTEPAPITAAAPPAEPAAAEPTAAGAEAVAVVEHESYTIDDVLDR